MTNTVESALTLPKRPEFPDRTKIVSEQQAEAARQAAEQAEAQRVASLQVEPAPAPVAAPVQTTDGLIGSIGYSHWGGNCVDEPGVNNPHNGFNPDGWPITSTNPWIGATVIFTWTHTAVISGLWNNGDIEVRQENAGGAPHRIPPSWIRGYR